MFDLSKIGETIENSIQTGIHNAFVNFFKWIAVGVIDNSYMICLTICMIALLLYIGGQRRAGKYVSLSFIIYFTLQALRRFVV